MIFDKPVSFEEAMEYLQQKQLLPTVLSSAELMEIAPEWRERALFSAAVADVRTLDVLGSTAEEILDGKLDLATGRLRLTEHLKEISYRPDAGDEGTIKDLRSFQRQMVQLETNVQMAQGYGYWKQGQNEAVLDEWPAQELIRVINSNEKRNWYAIWLAAGGRVFPGAPEGLPLVEGVTVEGRCIALKNDPIWTAISDFGLPYPPFKWGSGVDVADVSRDVAMAFGLIDRDTQIAPEDRGFNDDLEASLELQTAGLQQALEEQGYSFIAGILTR